ncbi:EST/SMG-like 1-like protein [Cladobotryum mycophilum]|uniref:EST/SMG-like 1-like protein n=1 Tax=Cladobotryum mycophilum TaxID=491253 RepID=A0ABR0SGJ8_9HYPO
MATADKPGIDKIWVDYLRNSSRRLKCPLCDADIQPPNLKAFTNHTRKTPDTHPALQLESDILQAFDTIKQNAKLMNPTSNPPTDNARSKSNRKRPVPVALEGQDDDCGPTQREMTPEPEEDEDHGNRKRRSPTSSVAQPRTPHARSSTPSRGREKQTKNTTDFGRGSTGGGNRQLWTPDDGQLPKTPQAKAPQVGAKRSSHMKQGRPQHPMQGPVESDLPEDPSVMQMIRQPDTRPISQEQLVAEVKGIYAGLVMVENKCIEVDNAQSSNKDSLRQLSNEQWQALIALHRTLLHEHHDFFLASQHPSASPALRRLASKYAMPARMWRHGIHSFLELLRHKLPHSLEPMLTFIYIAYSMMALLYETVPAFEDTWIECLGDLGRYRMAIEDDDIRDREIWTAVSRYWYSKASDKSPTTGRLYHHLAILARPNALQQVYYYTKSLCVPTPFLSARESVMTLFDPVLSSSSPRLEPIDAAFVRIHAIFFSGKSKDQLDSSLSQFYTLLDGQIARTTKGWLESGYFIGISIACSLLGYGDEFNVLKCAISSKRDESEAAPPGGIVSGATPNETFEQTLVFAIRTYEIITRRWGDMNILSYLHTTLVFLHHMTKFPTAMSHIETKFPWKLTALMLNYLKQSCKVEVRMESEKFPGALKNELPRPLPEDYALRGLVYTGEYFPADWFSNDKVDDDEKYFELASMIHERKERILWLGRRIASMDKWLKWDEQVCEFSAAEAYDIDLDDTPEMDSNMSRDEEGDTMVTDTMSQLTW